LFSFVIQVITGILLAMDYAPAVNSAYSSVRFVQEEVPLGRFVRAVHHWGASLMVILVLVHLVQVFVWGAYKRPREFTWIIGVLLLACTLGLAFTGYLLPWDEKAYWATKVGLGIASTVPLVGDALRRLLQGGPEIGNLTLTRFFALHGFILPTALALLAVAHLYLFRIHGVTPRWWASEEQLHAEAEPFWPGQAWKDAVLALAVLVGLGLWCYYRPAPLGNRADPALAYEARPEWYFMFLFQLLKYFEGPWEVVGTFVLPALFFLVLLFWPLLDRNPVRDPRRRPLAISLLLLGTAGLLGSTIYAVITDKRLPEAEMAASLEPAAAKPAGALQRMQVVKLYGDNCVACHGQDGTGNQIRAAMPNVPDFTSMAWQMSKTDLEITHQIHDGEPPQMPPFRDKLSQSEILGLTIYVRAFTAPPASALTQAPPPAAVASPKRAEPVAPGTAQPTPESAAKVTAPPAPERPLIPAAGAVAQMSADHIYRTYCLACHGERGRGSLVRAAMPEIPDFSDTKWQGSRRDAELQHSILEGKGKFMLPMKDKLGKDDAERMAAYVRRFARGGQLVRVQPGSGPGAATLPSPAEHPKPAPQPVVPSSGKTPQPPAAKPPKQPPMKPQTAPPVRPPEEEPVVTAAPPPSDKDRRINVATTLYRQYCLTCHGADARGTAIRAAMPAIPDFTNTRWQQDHSDPRLLASILDGKGTLMPAFRGRITPSDGRDLITYIRAFGPAVPSPAVAEAPRSDFQKQFQDLQRQWRELQRQADQLSADVPASK
jgi:quinol-cytochrome oxidoreductase complex cytochrome b subunit/mono/diheme cytochrome c family protein